MNLLRRYLTNSLEQNRLELHVLESLGRQFVVVCNGVILV